MNLKTLARLGSFLALASVSFAQREAAATAGGAMGSVNGTAAPEIDAALAAAALALVIGGVLLLTTERRKRLARS